MFHFWIDGHELRIIEADGVDTEEYVADQVVISVAQRYSILVTAKNSTELNTLPTTNFMIHANMDPEMVSIVNRLLLVRSEPALTLATAILPTNPPRLVRCCT